MKTIWHRCRAMSSSIRANVHPALSSSFRHADWVLTLADVRSVSTRVVSAKANAHCAWLVFGQLVCPCAAAVAVAGVGLVTHAPPFPGVVPVGQEDSHGPSLQLPGRQSRWETSGLGAGALQGSFSQFLCRISATSREVSPVFSTFGYAGVVRSDGFSTDALLPSSTEEMGP
jgi:hypothetical protein